MKEIKFRAWDDGKKEWLMGYEMPNLGGFSLLGELILLGEWSNVLNDFLFDRNGHKADDLKVMQFTGLKDKNGKEIYEGDIVTNTLAVRLSQQDFKNENLEKHGVIPPNYLSVIRDIRMLPFYEAQYVDDVEVIGNIYENPDLIKKK